jgi:hypothetical protein
MSSLHLFHYKYRDGFYSCCRTDYYIIHSACFGVHVEVKFKVMFSVERNIPMIYCLSFASDIDDFDAVHSDFKNGHFSVYLTCRGIWSNYYI